MDRNRRLVGAAIATAAAALFAAGTPSIAADDGSVKVRCYGANACKGQAECKTSMNSCKGHKGFVSMTEKACLEHFGRG
jgi:hypothetical protein